MLFGEFYLFSLLISVPMALISLYLSIKGDIDKVRAGDRYFRKMTYLEAFTLITMSLVPVVNLIYIVGTIGEFLYKKLKVPIIKDHRDSKDYWNR
jgi:hypothetical protein